MNMFRFTIKVFVIAIFMFAFASLAQAQASRTWVSGVGDDANPCSRTAPCKTWAGAISKTAACGEIDALDPGGFGAVTITKSITLDGSGTFASILASLVNGIIINAASTDVVTIRGISINGFCNGINGINILQAKTVNVEDCVIFRFNTGNGITVNETNDLNLHVRNTVVRDNTLDGINLFSSGGTVKYTIDNCRLSGNANGIHARNGSQGTIDRSVMSGNTTNGVFADATAGVGIARVWNSQITQNAGNGVRAGNAGGGTSVVQIAQCQVDNNTGNGVLVGSGGIVETFTNNSILGNGTNGCPGCTASGPGN
jgi:parallel beta-helix repeat protein